MNGYTCRAGWRLRPAANIEARRRDTGRKKVGALGSRCSWPSVSRWRGLLVHSALERNEGRQVAERAVGICAFYDLPEFRRDARMTTLTMVRRQLCPPAKSGIPVHDPRRGGAATGLQRTRISQGRLWCEPGKLDGLRLVCSVSFPLVDGRWIEWDLEESQGVTSPLFA